MCGYRGKFSLRDFRRLVGGAGARGLYAAIVAGVLGAAGALVLFGLPAQAQTPTPPPVELPWATATPAPMEAYICPVEPPAWWGTATPSAFWWLVCGHCADDWPRPHWDLPRPATWTPYPLPTIVITGTPFFSPTVVPSQTPTASPAPSPTPGPLPTPTPVFTYTGPITGFRQFDNINEVLCRASWSVHPFLPNEDKHVFGIYHPCGTYHMSVVYAGGQQNTKLEGLARSMLLFEFQRDPPPWPEGRVPPGVVYYPPISITYLITYSIFFEHWHLVDLTTSGYYHSFTGTVNIPAETHDVPYTRTVTVWLDSQRRVVHSVLDLFIYFPRLDDKITLRRGQLEIDAFIDTCPSGFVPPPSTPTPTPVVTATPTPTTTPPYTGTSPCENPYLGGTPAEIITPPSYGGVQCFEFRGTDLVQLPIIGEWGIPHIRICFAEMFLGQVRVFGVTVNLDTIAGILAGLLVFRLLSEV